MGMDTDMPMPMPGTGQDAVVLQGDFAWDLETGPSLTELDLKVPVGSLVTIVGQTGSGKSSMLAAALGLMNQTEGPAPQVHGKVSPFTLAHHIDDGMVIVALASGEVPCHRHCIAAARVWVTQACAWCTSVQCSEGRRLCRWRMCRSQPSSTTRPCGRTSCLASLMMRPSISGHWKLPHWLLI